MTDDWSLIMDDWWLITDDWWLMIDDWWLMSDEWWLMIDDKINTNIIWNVKYRLPLGGPPWGKQYVAHPFHIIFVFILSSIINPHSSLINQQSSIISRQSANINHQSSMINEPSSFINYQSSTLCRYSVINFLPTLCDHFFLTCMQRRGNRLGTFGHHRRPSGRIGSRREPAVNPR